MDKKKKIMIGAVGLGLAALAYFLFFKKEEKPVYGPGGEDGLDNPIQGAYQGDKPRSTGNASTELTLEPKSGFSTCLPALESEGGGKGKFISIDDPYTPRNIEDERRKMITDNLSVGDTIDLDGRACKIDKFWEDSSGRKAAIACEDHSNITYNANSQICW